MMTILWKTIMVVTCPPPNHCFSGGLNPRVNVSYPVVKGSDFLENADSPIPKADSFTHPNGSLFGIVLL